MSEGATARFRRGCGASVACSCTASPTSAAAAASRLASSSRASPSAPHLSPASRRIFDPSSMAYNNQCASSPSPAVLARPPVARQGRSPLPRHHHPSRRRRRVVREQRRVRGRRKDRQNKWARQVGTRGWRLVDFPSSTALAAPPAHGSTTRGTARRRLGSRQAGSRLGWIHGLPESGLSGHERFFAGPAPPAPHSRLPSLTLTPSLPLVQILSSRKQHTATTARARSSTGTAAAGTRSSRAGTLSRAAPRRATTARRRASRVTASLLTVSRCVLLSSLAEPSPRARAGLSGVRGPWSTLARPLDELFVGWRCARGAEDCS